MQAPTARRRHLPEAKAESTLEDVASTSLPRESVQVPHPRKAPYRALIAAVALAVVLLFLFFSRTSFDDEPPRPFAPYISIFSDNSIAQQLIGLCRQLDSEQSLQDKLNTDVRVLLDQKGINLPALEVADLSNAIGLGLVLDAARSHFVNGAVGSGAEFLVAKKLFILSAKIAEESNAKEKVRKQINVALVDLLTGQYLKALEHLEALEKTASDSTVFLYKAYALEALKRKDQAILYYGMALQDKVSHADHFYHEKVYYKEPVECEDYIHQLLALLTVREFHEQFHSSSFVSKRRPSFLDFSGPGLTFTPTSLQERWHLHWHPAIIPEAFDINGGVQNLEQARQFFEDYEFVVLRRFITDTEVAILNNFYHDLLNKGLVKSWDGGLHRAHMYNERVSCLLNQRFRGVISFLDGRNMTSSYSFLCRYDKRGQEIVKESDKPWLMPHTDREDNDVTVSIQLEVKDGMGLKTWPLYVHKFVSYPIRANNRPLPPNEHCFEINLRDGDAIVFRGRRHEHHRHRMPDSMEMFTSLLLHFVDVNFDAGEYKARQRQDPTI